MLSEPTSPLMNERQTTIILEQGYQVTIDNQNKSRRFSSKLLLGIIFLFIFLFIGIFATFLWNASENKKSDRNTLCLTPECLRSASNLYQDMNFQINPCDDFYQFACGNWAINHLRNETTQYSDWDIEITNKILYSIREFLEFKPTVDEPKIIYQSRVMYQSCMKFESGKLAIENYLSKFHLPKLPSIFNNKRIGNKSFSWVKSIAEIKKTLGIDIIFGFEIVTNIKNRTRKGIKFGIPNEKISLINDNTESADYETDMKNEKEHLEADFNYSIHLMNPEFDGSLSDAFAKIWELDNILYRNEEKNVGTLKEEYENIGKFERKVNRSNIEWHEYLETIFEKNPIDSSNQLIFASVEDIKYLQTATDYIENVSLEEMELYIWWKFVTELAEYTREGRNENSFDCASVVKYFMPMMTSYAILKPNFQQTTKPKLLELLEDIRTSFNEFVEDDNWMDSETKRKIFEKSKAIKFDVGYPDWLKNEQILNEYYGTLNLNENNLLENIIETKKNDMSIELKSLGVTGQIGFRMPPIEVNANYNRGTNTITIPMAILQYPYYELSLESLNYGALGSVLGHEFFHGFDESGRQFDTNGNWRKNWWKSKTLTEYFNRTSCFINQYQKYKIPGTNYYVNGNKTLDENISDNYGMRAAFYAYQKYVERHGEEKNLSLFENHSQKQLFFISYANRWCYTGPKDTTMMDYESLKNDPHSPKQLRVNVVLGNSREFQDAFKCSVTSKMSFKTPCRIW